MSTFKDLIGIRFLSQNVNSMNLSSRFQIKNKLNRFDQKLESFLSKKAGIIFLQDMRLGLEGEGIFRKRLEFHKYGNFHLYSNSSKSSRGVAIVIDSKIPYKILDSVKCNLENYIILKISVRDSVFIIGSVYGPTVTQDTNFMENLKRDIISMGNYDFLIGGDFNMVSDGNKITAANKFNLDILNMSQIPNVKNSQILSSWCENGFTVDIFRHFYAEKRVFSHVPFNKRDHSRSRIDLFLCSSNFIKSFANLTYLPIDSKVFDHKGVLLEPAKLSPRNMNFLDPSLLDIPGLKQVCRLETLGTFCDYIDPVLNPLFLVDLDTCLTSAREIMADVIAIKNSISNDKLIIAIIETKCKEIDDRLSPFLNINDILTRIQITIGYDKFLETLMNNLHNSIMTHQRAHKKIYNTTLRDLRKRLTELQGMNLNPSSSHYKEQLDLESKILDFDDDLNLRNCKRTKLWHSMNFERPTKAFCTLAKATKCNDSLKQLKKTDFQGNSVDYETDDERNADIECFFKDIYGKIPDKSLTLEQFLTPDILNSDYVQSKKLSNLDSARDNVPISHHELTEALEETKLGSSPGLDGYTYVVLKFLWPLIGHVLAKGFEVMVEKEELYPNLRTASIKLIPKKGNCEQIKNWRPISLLSNVYKVFSKAFANRLKRVSDVITSNSQKAYSKSKVIHEALLNILQCIKKGKLENKRLSVLSIDFKKAFDSVSHEYIIEVLKFYNFSDYMIKIVRTSMNQKIAGIMAESGIISFFSILCGVAQGDAPSGLIFILCLEPLLWKLSLEHGIRHPVFENGGTIDDSSYADDVSILLEGDPEIIIRCKIILEDFGKLSGLKINSEKTQILSINASPDFAEQIAVTGFTVVEHLTILGIVISENFETDEVNYRKLLGKIRGQSIFWSKFKLSTVGRINIAKTYLLSQISYFAPVLSFTKAHLKTLRTDIGTFIKGNLKISIDKVFDPIHAGGLGMIDVASFINSMKIVFYRKSFENNDFWAKEVQKFRISSDYPYHIKSNIIDDTPCAGLTINFRDFCNIYWETAGNILDLRIYDNESAPMESGEKLSLNHFRLNLTMDNILSIKKLKLINLVNARNPRIFNELSLTTHLGFQPNQLETFYLKSIHRRLIRYAANKVDERCTPIKTFFRRVKGSFRVRKFLNNSNSTSGAASIGLAKRKALADDNTLNAEGDCNYYMLFNTPKLENKLRSFIFSFTSQSLYHNGMIAHFVQNFDPTCQRCEKNNIRPAPKESISHIFWDCPNIQIILSDLNDIISNGMLPQDRLRKVLFLGYKENDVMIFNVKTTNIICLIVLFYIFTTRDCKSPYMKCKLLNFIDLHISRVSNLLFSTE